MNGNQIALAIRVPNADRIGARIAIETLALRLSIAAVVALALLAALVARADQRAATRHLECYQRFVATGATTSACAAEWSDMADMDTDTDHALEWQPAVAQAARHASATRRRPATARAHSARRHRASSPRNPLGSRKY